MKITIVTPTFKRNGDILRRCLASVQGQTWTNWEHLVIVDDVSLKGHISDDILQQYASPNRKFLPLGYNANNWANTPRQVGIEHATGELIAFLDDDNILFPDALEQYVRFFETFPDNDMAICQILHCGPLHPMFGRPPARLDGNPPVVANIDTLQVCIKSPIAKQYGWLDKGYCADGYTIELWSSQCRYGYLEKLLGIHL